MLNKKRIAILLGDPSGIGPEIVSKLLCEKIVDDANILIEFYLDSNIVKMYIL